jgi:hypothetical protein
VAAPKRTKFEHLTESNKMLTPKYQNEKKLELLRDVNTALGVLKKGEIKTFSIGDANHLLEKGYAREIA